MAENTFVTPAGKKKNGFRKFLGWLVVIILFIGGILIWWNYYYVYGEGVKSGELNYVVKKGNIFKTYEGKLIQSGFRSKTMRSPAVHDFRTNGPVPTGLRL